MIYGYCRISTPKQNIERQERNILEKNSKARIFKESYTGTTQDRPTWKKLMEILKAGDTIIFDSVSRMSRNAEEGFKDYEDLFSKGINLIFLKEPHINTETYKAAQKNQIELTDNEIADIYIKATNEVLLLLAKQQIKIAYEQAEKEVMDLRNRVTEGMITARLNGKQIGRQEGTRIETKKSKVAKEKIVKHSKYFNGSLSDYDCMRLCGVSRNTFYRYKRELTEENI